MSLLLADAIAAFCKKHQLLKKNESIVVGVSGGPDSLCLLHVLKTLSADLALTLTVAHLNHQLRADAAEDAAFVQDIANQWGLAFISESHNVAKIAAQQKQSVEEAARQVRYDFLGRIAATVGAAKIAVGHHGDDQAETVLMHFLRGTGLAGLRGMLPATAITGLRLHNASDTQDTPDTQDAPDTPEPAPWIIRPLLETPRTTIEAYCRQHQLSPRFDYTNKDTTLFRNRLRYELLPQLATYNPNIRQVLQRTAAVVTADVEFLQAHVEQAWATIVKDVVYQQSSARRVELDLAAWSGLPVALQRATLRKAVQTLRRSLRDILFEHIETAREIALRGQTGAQATLPQGLILTVSYRQLIIADAAAVVSPDDEPRLTIDEPLSVKIPGTTPLPSGGWQLKANLLPGDKVSLEQAQQVSPWEVYLDAATVGENLWLRPRRPGDTFCPLGLGGRHKKVNEFMIDRKIPASRRDSLPVLVAAGEQILWICGYRPAEQARLQTGTEKILHLKFVRS